MGGVLEKELSYSGDTLKEIAQQIQHDENELLYYMKMGDDKGIRAFCFAGFMFSKNGLITARLCEPEF